MSEIATFDPLCTFGYSLHEARWLRRVITHAGVFLRRQYRAFLGVGPGGREQRLDARLRVARHATVLPYHGRERLYHVRSHALYAALGHENSRLRRALPAPAATERLMVLDFISREPREYLASEHEKVSALIARCGLTCEHFPKRVYYSAQDRTKTTTRYFVDRYPIALEHDCVHFVVPDLAPRAAAVFAGFLLDYRPLLEAVPQAEIIYVTGPAENGRAAQTLFERACAPLSPTSNPAHVEALDQYFTTRRALEQHAYGQLSADRLDRHHDDVRRYAGPATERLYAEWLRGGVIALTRAIHAAPLPRRRITFRHVTLPWRYYCLGVDTRFAHVPARAAQGNTHANRADQKQ